MINEDSPLTAQQHHDKANVCREQADYEGAIYHGEQAIAMEPENALFHVNLANAYSDIGNDDKALNLYEQALVINPRMHYAHSSIGVIHQFRGEHTLAEEHYEKALRIAPYFPDNEYNLSLAYLRQGRLEEGWEKFSAREAMEPPIAHNPFSWPIWQGESLTDKHIVVIPEQGIGEEILFASCIPLLQEEAKECTLLCSAKLQNLFHHSFPDCFTVGYDRKDPRHITAIEQTIKNVDYGVLIGSLPKLLEVRLNQA